MIIQSEQTAEYCETRVEAFFDTMKTEIEEMTPEAFLEHKEGLEKKLREAHKNLGEETAVFTAQIDTGHLDFMRNDKDADMLAEVTKDDILALFMSKIHSSSKTRSKLSVHMLSQKPRPQQVSMAAAEAFEALVHDANTGVDAAAWKAALGDGPLSAVSLGQYWLKALEGKKEKETLLQAFPGLLEKYPLEVPKLATEIIQDTRAFQSSLALSEKPVAIVWGDLPVPKL
ncbi:hypothetical protein C8J56DRAFT_77488 [Mycena floridula]|nr:hypothetical protein C8J56DRAFT_77488 [Mycena floridula]